MSFSNKELKPGDILITESNEIYCYLGYYTGRPASMYTMPQEGYLYLFLDSITSYHSEEKVRDIISEKNVLHNLDDRLRFRIDGHAAYTKSYKKFHGRLGHVGLDVDNIRWAYGLKRLGDKRSKNLQTGRK